MQTIRLVHWNAAEAERRAAQLQAAGYDVRFAVADGPNFVRELRETPPAAVVIDLSRLPMQGRDLALTVRAAQATRFIPLVFAGGEAEKVARVQETLPDAVYTPWHRIRSALKRAIAHPPSDPVRPRSVLAGYSGRPLAKKLGIKPAMTVGLIAAPEDFAQTLGELPPGVRLRNGARGHCGLLIWFVRSRQDLHCGIDRMAKLAADGPLWMAWPKRAAQVQTDLTENEVRQTGLDAGLVDYKVCAIDTTWSGLLFRKRRIAKE
jgi:CheY-like chemotaxis protein